MLDARIINSRLKNYFEDFRDEIDHDESHLKKDWQEFYQKSFCTPRNSATEKLNDQLAIKISGPQVRISDNVLILESLNDFVSDLVKEAFVIADKVPYDFLEDYYRLNFFPEEVLYINNINNGDDLNTIIDLYKNSRSSYIVAIGGGRTLDYAKYVTWRTGAILIAIPTSLATHVYASPKIHALQPIKDHGYSMTINGDPAHLTLIDSMLMEHLLGIDKRLVFSGFGDIMAFINAKHDWKAGSENGKERYSPFVDKSIEFIIKVLENIDIERSLSYWISDYVFIQCLLCHITDWVGSAPASGAEHLFAKCIEEEVDNLPLHGEVVALGVLIFCHIRGIDVDLVVSLLNKFNISNSLKDLKVNKNSVVKALSQSINEGISKGRYTLLNELDVSANFFEVVIDQMLKKRLILE